MRRGGDYLSNKVAGLCGASLNYARKGGVNMSLFRLGNPLLVMGGTASADLFSGVCGARFSSWHKRNVSFQTWGFLC